MPSHPPAIAVEGLTKAYGKVQALDGLDLQVAPGTVFGLLGPNGAGKSTTVRILTTLSRPDAGPRDRRGPRRAAPHPTVCAARSAPCRRSRGSTPSPPAARTWCCRAASTACAPATPRPCDSAAGPLRARRGRRPPGAHLVGWHAAQARRGTRAGPPAAGAVPRRAHHRAGPRGTRRHVGRDRPRSRATRASPCCSRPTTWTRPTASPTPRDRRPRQGRRPRHARRAEVRAARRRHAGRGRRRR